MKAEFEFAALRHAINYRQALVREFTPVLGKRVLEIGAGVGQMTELLARAPGVEETVGLEPDPRFALEFRARCPEVLLIQGTSRTLDTARDWDSLVSVNVLEHIENDQEELAIYRRLLASAHGSLCLFVPARPELYAPIDEDFGHYRRYTKRELGRKLATAGFQICRLHYFNLMGYFGWFVTFRLLARRKFDTRAVQFFDRFIFPLEYGVARRLRFPPLGQSLLAVARSA